MRWYIMPTITLSVPEQLKKNMEEFNEINWSAVARNAIAKKVQLLKKIDKLLSRSTITEEEAVNLGRMINAKIAKKHKW
jgi:hypothetical protein